MKPLSAVVFVAGALALVLSGCAAPQGKSAAGFNQELAKASAECDEMRAAGEIVTYTERAQCLNDKEAVIYADAGYPYMDLVARYHAERLRVAEDLDYGQMTLDQAKAELTALEQDLSAEAKERAMQEAATGGAAAAEPGEAGAEDAIEPAAGPAE